MNPIPKKNNQKNRQKKQKTPQTLGIFDVVFEVLSLSSTKILNICCWWTFSM